MARLSKAVASRPNSGVANTAAANTRVHIAGCCSVRPHVLQVLDR